jgi:hypothetical protein
MKTLNFFFAAATLSIALVSCQKETIEPSQPATDVAVINTGLDNNVEDASVKSTKAVTVRYEIAVHLVTDKPLCNRYQVEVVDGTGKAVAQPVAFDPTKSSYSFYEQTRQSSGIRIARIVLVNWPEHFVCETELFTPPSGRVVNFHEGASYLFDLYPSAQPSKGKE